LDDATLTVLLSPGRVAIFTARIAAAVAASVALIISLIIAYLLLIIMKYYDI
jgi:hypothetical protein